MLAVSRLVRYQAISWARLVFWLDRRRSRLSPVAQNLTGSSSTPITRPHLVVRSAHLDVR